jgi:hypothetical protein
MGPKRLTINSIPGFVDPMDQPSSSVVTVVYVGFCFICVGTLFALLMGTRGHKKLSQVWKERLNTAAVGLIGLGTILSLFPSIQDFRRAHSAWAVCVLACLALFAFSLLSVFILFPGVLKRFEGDLRDEETDQDSDIDQADVTGRGAAEKDRHGNQTDEPQE